jgi:isopenicillin N synthase-like dioxygenase
VVDFALARTGSEEDRRRVAKELHEAFKNVGFAYVKNHGVPQDVVDEAFAWVCRSQLSSTSHLILGTVGWGAY